MNNSDLPLVSVAIAAYNQEQFIEQAVKSVIDQGYDNLEICISDDCSTDNTQIIIQGIVQNLVGSKVRVKYNFNENNLGIVKNYNKLITMCSGDYITWLDGDDLFLPGKIKSQVEFMEKNLDCVISHTKCEVFSNSTNACMFLVGGRKTPKKANFLDLLQKGVFFKNCTIMVRGDAQRSVMFDEEFRIVGDWGNKLQILKQTGLYIYYLDKVLSRYRVHGSNTSSVLISKELRQNEKDLINQHIKFMNSYPEFAFNALIGLSRFYRYLGATKNRRFFKVAFILNPFNLKNLICFIIYYLLPFRKVIRNIY